MKEHESGKQATGSFDDIQRTHMILLPRASDHTHEQNVAFRMITLGKKRLPNPESALAAGQEPGVSTFTIVEREAQRLTEYDIRREPEDEPRRQFGLWWPRLGTTCKRSSVVCKRARARPRREVRLDSETEADL